MRETLYLRLREPAAHAPTAYAITGPEPGASVFVREAPLSEVLDHAPGRRVVAFVSGAEVRLTQVRVPARQPSKVLQAAPFVLEDQFAEDVETLHFALGARQPDGAFPIAVASHENMNEWLAPFRAAAAPLHALVPETLALPWADGAWAVLAEPGQLTVRSGICSGFSCLPDELGLYLQLAQTAPAESPLPPLRVLLSRGATDDFSSMERTVELLPGFFDPLEALIRHLRLPQSINLLQAEYSQREQLDRLWVPWQRAGIAAAVAFVLGLSLNGIQAVRANHAANAQDVANAARFQQLFPNEGSNVNLQSLLEQKESILHGTPTNGGLLFLIQQAAQALSATPGLNLKTLQFRDHALFLDLGGTDLQVLEKLQAWFTEHGGSKVEVESANAGEGEVQIRLKLSAL